MRLFIALSLPERILAELATIQQHLLRSGNHPVKWVTPAAIHLTLQFLGEVQEARVPELLAAMQTIRANGHHSPHIRLTQPGAFPNLRRPQTVWVGVGGDLAGLERIYQSVITVTTPLGFLPERRPFRAHLTLGRTRREASPTQQAALGTAICALPMPNPTTWECGEPILFQSTLTPSGAIYTALNSP